MPIGITCSCGVGYKLKDELAGTLVQCPKCRASMRVPGGQPAGPPPDGCDPAFHRNAFLLRQRVFAIDEKYGVCDETGREFLFVVRPARLAERFAAILTGLSAGGLVFYAAWRLSSGGDHALAARLLGAALAFAAFVATTVALYPKRHAAVYRDAGRREKLLEVLQDQVFVLFVSTYTVRAPDGSVIASLRKDHLHDFFRKRWRVFRPDGALWAVAVEDSLILSLLRRFIGPLFGALRTNFVILDGGSGEALGEFNRKLTLLDRYVLDMTPDGQARLDRRVALALGVLLDSAEGR